jgi:hypothetical protein
VKNSFCKTGVDERGFADPWQCEDAQELTPRNRGVVEGGGDWYTNSEEKRGQTAGGVKCSNRKFDDHKDAAKDATWYEV